MMTAFLLLRQRLNDSAQTTLRDIVAGSPALRRFSEPMACGISRHAAEIRRELSAKDARQTLADMMTAGFFRFLFDKYQYVQPSALDHTEIADSYRRLTDTAARRTGNLLFLLQDRLGVHHDCLQAVTTRLLTAAGALDDVLGGANPLCRQYSPELQCRVLGLTDADACGPVLDLGCGEAAALVAFMRARGIAAWGLDRLAPETEYTLRQDWFDIPAPSGAWKTIVAHMSFSLHFVHAHFHSGEEARQYALAYMKILHGLRPGGSFVYAPGLSFIEPFLEPEKFRVAHRSIPVPGIGTVSVSRVTKLPGPRRESF